MREYEKMIAGLDYYPMNDEELVELRRISLEKTREFNAEPEDNVYFNANCVVLDCAKVKIGENTFIGPNTQFYTPIHPLDYKTRNTFIESAKPITVGKNCWLGGSVVLLPGVTIGDGCVIGAGAVVTKDIPANSLAVGNPAKVIKTIEQN